MSTFTLNVDKDGDVHGAWRVYEVSLGRELEATLTAPKGVSDVVFEGRVRVAVDALNGETARDVATVYSMATAELAARQDHWDGLYYELVGRAEERARCGTSEKIAKALGYEGDHPDNWYSVCEYAVELRQRLAKAEARIALIEEAIKPWA